jgi:hypothetical protein
LRAPGQVARHQLCPLDSMDQQFTWPPRQCQLVVFVVNWQKYFERIKNIIYLFVLLSLSLSRRQSFFDWATNNSTRLTRFVVFREQKFSAAPSIGLQRSCNLNWIRRMGCWIDRRAK